MRQILALLLLTACTNSPSPKVWGGQSQEVTVSGRAYTVTWTTSDFEVVRHGWSSPGENQAIRATMLTLVPQVTHCRMLEGAVQGDSGEIHGPLTC